MNGLDDFTFEGLDHAFARIRQHAHEAGYLVLHDRTDSHNEETLARFDFDSASARPYLSRAALDEDEDFMDLGPPVAEAYDDPDTEEVDDGEELSPERIADAACIWLRETAAHNTLGEPWRRYRVRIYGPKSYKKLDSVRFIVRSDFDEEAEAPEGAAPVFRPLPAPDPARAEQLVAVRGMHHLGEAYRQFTNLLLGTVGQLQSMTTSNLNQVNRQLTSSRDQVEHLVDAILSFRTTEAAATRSSEAEARDDAMRATLAKSALEQIGTAAQALLVSNGVPPETKDLLLALKASPELMQALQDPTVRVMMQDPNNLQALATLLRTSAAQYEAMRQQAAGGHSAPTAPPPPPPPPPAPPA